MIQTAHSLKANIMGQITDTVCEHVSLESSEILPAIQRGVWWLHGA